LAQGHENHLHQNLYCREISLQIDCSTLIFADLEPIVAKKYVFFRLNYYNALKLKRSGINQIQIPKFYFLGVLYG